MKQQVISDKKIVIVEDEKEILDLLNLYLGNEGFEVISFSSSEGVLEYINANIVDLAILDVMVPGTDGFTILRKIRERWFFPVIMLTAKIEETDKIHGITLGADDYITKPFHPLEVVARVKAQLRRAGAYNTSLSKEEEYYNIRGLEVFPDRHKVLLYGENIELTPMEFSILLYLCQHINQAVTSEELFENVWGEKYLGNNNTVFAHIAKLREKMHENARKPKFIKTVWGVGYRMEE